MSNAANSNRNSRIDILRAVSMLMIVTCHFIYHGIRHVTEGDTFPDLGFSASLTGEINFFFCQLLGYLTNIGPNLFILITGYFLIKPRDFRYALRKALHLWLIIVFYSLASLLAASPSDKRKSVLTAGTACLLSPRLVTAILVYDHVLTAVAAFPLSGKGSLCAHKARLSVVVTRIADT